MESHTTRRDFLRTSAVIGTGLVIAGCTGGNVTKREREQAEASSENESDEKG